MNQYLRDKNEKGGKYETEGTNKAKHYHTELETKQHEDRVRHLEVKKRFLEIFHMFFFLFLQKVLNKNKEIEFELRKSVKEAEFQRRKKEQDVQRLRDDLVRKKKEDAKKIRAAIIQVEQDEKELERHLIKENGKLNKVK